MITNELISDLVYCKRKYYLRLNKKQRRDEFSEFITHKKKTIFKKYREECLLKISCIIENSEYEPVNKKMFVKEYYLSNILFHSNEFYLHLDFLEIKHIKSSYSITPIFIHPFSRISKEYRAYYQTITWKYAEYRNIQISKIKIICGEELILRSIKTNDEIARGVLCRRLGLTEDEIHKSFTKIKHCNKCGNWEICKDILIERDDLSLLGNISSKEITNYNNKGIFTINQLSFAFRPTKSKMKATNRNRRFQYGLRALALREKKTIIQNIPDFHEKKCLIYFDFESIPEKKFIYLIGLLVVENGVNKKYSFWANKTDNEESIFIKFFSILKNKKDFTCYHYGAFELIKLREFNKKHRYKYDSELSLVEDNSINVLSIFNSNIHPPTYTNGLKDIASYFSFKWTIPNASGIKCLILREKWNKNNNENIKTQIKIYNIEDCMALDHIIQNIKSFQINKESGDYIKLNKLYSYKKYGHNSYNTEYFKNIAKYAYFDYQRTKVFLQTNKRLKKINKDNRKKKPQVAVNKQVKLNERCLCPKCISCNVYIHDSRTRTILDLKFMAAGIKRWVIEYKIYRFKCTDCGFSFVNPATKKIIPRNHYGYNLKVWVIYQNIACRVPMNKIQETLESVFKLFIEEGRLLSFKQEIAKKYRPLYDKYIENLIKGNLIHADETRISIRGIESKGYVWIVTNMETVVFIFRKNREVDFLKKLLNDFNGVFISDFYSGYDNIPCKQQKCLIHLIRDLNDDLYKNPLDFKYKEIVIRFADLLNIIISTVNNKGLKKRFLNKHKRDINVFYKWLINSQSDSELFQSYRKRFLKNREKLFQFINEDGIPWNNNNAEHGIKHFAAYRKIADGLFTISRIDDYLILLSIFQTCKYRKIDFLHFLRFDKYP